MAQAIEYGLLLGRAEGSPTRPGACRLSFGTCSPSGGDSCAIAAASRVRRLRLDSGPLRELAAACGVAHPSLYRHFENAEALTLSVAAACFRDFSRDVAAAVARATDPLARLRAGCETSIRWGLAHRARYALMTGPELAGKQHHQEFFAAAKESFDGLVDAVAACGVTDAVPVAHTVMSAVHDLVDLLRKGRTIPHKAATADEQIDAMLQMVIEYAQAKSEGAVARASHRRA